MWLVIAIISVIILIYYFRHPISLVAQYEKTKQLLARLNNNLTMRKNALDYWDSVLAGCTNMNNASITGSLNQAANINANAVTTCNITQLDLARDKALSASIRDIINMLATQSVLLQQSLTNLAAEVTNIASSRGLTNDEFTKYTAQYDDLINKITNANNMIM